VVTILESAAIQFFSTISMSTKEYVRWWFYASSIKVITLMIFGLATTQFSSTIFMWTIEYTRWRFYTSTVELIALTIPGSRATQFLSTILESIMSVCADESKHQPMKQFRWWFLSRQRLSFCWWFLNR
jgi:hypothetical protein